MNYPDDLRYARNHEWVRTDGSMVRMGISDYAQDALGDVVYVELPKVGTTVERGQAFSEVESTKSVSDVYAPVSGRVVEVNDALDSNPELINSDPYGDGWFVVIEATDLGELDDLSHAAEYEAGLA
jgi:glycine cleavage system H protein